MKPDVNIADQKGSFELLVRSYATGTVSLYFDSVKVHIHNTDCLTSHLTHTDQVGDYIEVKGPEDKLKYSPNMKRHIGMLAGGTGIAPMMQVCCCQQ